MLTSIDETGAGDYSAGLWCFQSDELLSTEWNKQGWKPANVSAVCMRNGGLLEYQEHTFRVGQVSDFGEYGSRVHINIIDTSESKYSEQLRDVVTPEPISGAIGLHHISGDNQITVFDYFSKK